MPAVRRIRCAVAAPDLGEVTGRGRLPQLTASEGGEGFRPATAREQSAIDLNGLEADSSSQPSGKSGLVDTLILGL